MATPEQWEQLANYADVDCIAESCILELRDRIEALEAKLASPPFIIVPSISDEQLEKLKQPGRIEVLAPGDQMVATAPPVGLVKRVADVIYRNGTGDGFLDEARSAIREVADWFTTIAPRGSEAWRMASEVLWDEANR